MSEQALELRGVWRSFSHFALRDVSMALPRGQIMGLIGPNGSGKSTTIRILMGLMAHQAGTVELLGRSIPEEAVLAREEVSLVSEDMGLYGGATVAWHVGFVRSLVPRWDDAYARDLADRFGLPSDQKVKQLSHGQRVKLGLLLALARRPRLLILDEPTSGLDPIARQEVLAELLEVIQVGGRSVLFSTHHTPDVERIADLVTIIDQGGVLEHDSTVDLLDRWRRIRVYVHHDREISLPNDCTWVSKEGRHRTIISNGFGEGTLHHLSGNGASVVDVQHLSLEEVFTRMVSDTRAELPR